MNEPNVNVAQQVDADGNPIQTTDEIQVEPVSAEEEAKLTATPEAPAAEPEPQVVEEPQPFTDDARNDIYKKAADERTNQDQMRTEDMDPEEKALHDQHIRRMELEAQGDNHPDVESGEQTINQVDPYSEEEPAAVSDPNQPAEPAVDPSQGYVPAALQGVDLSAETTTIVVFGEQMEVPTSEVVDAGGIGAIQKSKAADIRLTRLAEEQDRTRDWQNRLQDLQAQLMAGQVPQNSQSPDGNAPEETGAPDYLETAKTIVASMYEGNEDEAAQKLAETFSEMNRREQNQLATGSPEELRRMVHEAVASTRAEEQQVSDDSARQAANDAFRNEFPDLLYDPAKKAATQAEIELVRQDPIMRGQPMEAVVREAGYRSRAKFAGHTVPQSPSHGPAPVIQLSNEPSVAANAPAPVPSDVPVNDLNSRLELKRRTVITPSAQGAAPTTAPTEPTTATGADIVAQMRKDRGLPPQ